MQRMKLLMYLLNSIPFSKAAQNAVNTSMAMLERYAMNFQLVYIYIIQLYFNIFMFTCIKLQYIIAQSHQEYILVVGKLKNAVCIRIDTNYA